MSKPTLGVIVIVNIIYISWNVNKKGTGVLFVKPRETLSNILSILPTCYLGLPCLLYDFFSLSKFHLGEKVAFFSTGPDWVCGNLGTAAIRHSGLRPWMKKQFLVR